MDDFLDGIVLLARHTEDPSLDGRRPVCRDPDDEYLLALAEHTQATYLVSGDKDLLTVQHGGVIVRSPRDVLHEMTFDHPWGQGLLPGRDDEALRQAEAEGHGGVLRSVFTFLVAVEQPDAEVTLPALVTPESFAAWVDDLPGWRRELADRGIASRPEYPSPDVAYVKLPPDPGQTIRTYQHTPLRDTLILTLQRRPELSDALRTGGWRVHALGDYVPPEDLPGG